MTKIHQAIPTRLLVFDVAVQKIGLQELSEPGKHDQEIISFAKDIGHAWVSDDELAWCASFFGSCMKSAGMQYLRTLRARDYAGFGKSVKYDPATGEGILPGHGLVFTRGANPLYGHLAFACSCRKGIAYVLGGNQSNQVNVSPYKLSRLIYAFEPEIRVEEK